MHPSPHLSMSLRDMGPFFSRKREKTNGEFARGQAGEGAAFADHMRLVGIAAFKRDIGEGPRGAQSIEHMIEANDPRRGLRTEADMLPERGRKMLARAVKLGRDRFDRRAACGILQQPPSMGDERRRRSRLYELR